VALPIQRTKPGGRPRRGSQIAVAVIKQLENEINETEAALADVTARSGNVQKMAMNSQEGIAMNS